MSLSINIVPFGPSLIQISVGTGPGLQDIAIGLISIGKVEAKGFYKRAMIVSDGLQQVRRLELTCACTNKPTIPGVEPLLSGKVIVALPDLHLRAVNRILNFQPQEKSAEDPTRRTDATNI
jgi:hypothetical protein